MWVDWNRELGEIQKQAELLKEKMIQDFMALSNEVVSKEGNVQHDIVLVAQAVQDNSVPPEGSVLDITSKRLLRIFKKE